jgi:hypothetical protein
LPNHLGKGTTSQAAEKSGTILVFPQGSEAVEENLPEPAEGNLLSAYPARRGQKVAWLLYGGFVFHFPPVGYGHSLPFIYAIWLAVVLGLYPLCKWFAEFKHRHPNQWWWRYLL